MSADAPTREIVPGDPEWPPFPPDMTEPVERLFVRGRSLDSLGPLVSIVGSRRATPYGLDIARSLAADLAVGGACVVSGMAFGIDAAAHEGALAAGGATLAVLASGVDVITPPAHADLYRRILRSGAVISERPLGYGCARWDYPVRNRIIAAIARGVVVVQGEERSGTAHTARWAKELDRQVYAVPGDLRASMSALPHALLRDGAAICESADDILKLVDRLPDARERAIPDGLPPAAEAILRALSHAGPLTLEELVRGTELSHDALEGTVVDLEIDGFIARDLGRTYKRIR